MTNRYRTIVADPPWDVKTGPSWGHNDKNTPLNPSSHGLTYETMTVAQIKAIRPPAADGAHLYLWTINAYIEAAYEIARAWGFYPSTLLAWCKKPKGIGLGGTYALSSEYVLFAHRGSLPAKRRVERNWWVWPRTFPHSRKPEAFLDLVESVSPGPYLEMFARRNRSQPWSHRMKCPTCTSPAPHLHPSVQHEGETEPCIDPFHDADDQQRDWLRNYIVDKRSRAANSQAGPNP